MRPPVIDSNRIFVSAISADRSEEHTSELQSQSNLVCRLLLEKKKHLEINCSFLITSVRWAIFPPFPLGHVLCHRVCYCTSSPWSISLISYGACCFLDVVSVV